MNRRSGCNPIRGPRLIDGERKIDDREGEKKGKKKIKKKRGTLGGGQRRWAAELARNAADLRAKMAN